MSRLEEIKNEYAIQLAEIHDRSFTSWREMMDTDFEFGNGVSKVYDLESLTDEVAKIYTKECIKASLEKASKSANLLVSTFSSKSEYKERTDLKDGLWGSYNEKTIVNKESIINQENIILL